MGRRHGLARSENRWSVRTGAGAHVDTGPGAAAPNRSRSRGGRETPLQVKALSEADERTPGNRVRN